MMFKTCLALIGTSEDVARLTGLLQQPVSLPPCPVVSSCLRFFPFSDTVEVTVRQQTIFFFPFLLPLINFYQISKALAWLA